MAPVGGKLNWNDAEFDRLLNSPDGPTGRMLGHAGEAGAQGAKRRAPVSPDGSHGRPSGFLRSSIGWEVGKDAEGLYVDIAATARTPEGRPYPLYVEVGTAAHSIDSRGDYPLRDKHGNVFGKHVDHPGTPAQPFLRPCIDDIRAAM